MQDSGAAEGVITFRQAGQVVKGGWVMILTCTMLGIGLASALFVVVPASYTSTSAVSLAQGIVTASASPKDISTATEGAIAESTVVADRAAPLLKWPGAPAKLLANVSVTSPLDSQVLRISYSGSTSADAAAGANAFATAYLAYRTDTAQAGLQARLDRTGERIAELQKSSAAQGAIISDRKSSRAEKSTAVARRTVLARQINQFQDQQAVVAATTISAGHVVNKGSLPPGPDLALKIFLLGGILFGGVLGITLAMLRNLRDTRVRDAAHIEQSFIVPVLESIPEQIYSAGEPTALGALDDLGGSEADAYRSLAAKLTVGARPSCRRLLLVGAKDLENATTPVSLAVTLAAQGQRVLLFGSPEAMTNDCRLVNPDYAVAEVAAAGGRRAHRGVQELLRAGRLSVVSFGDELSLVATLRNQGDDELALMLKEVDILLIDAINVELASTALNLARLAHEALVVVRAGETHIPDVDKSLHELRQVALPVQGIVLLLPTRPRHPRGKKRDTRQTRSMSLSDAISVGSSQSQS
jgi:capsular polysaccharide biosynthesis protein